VRSYLAIFLSAVASSFAATTITKTNYHGWPNSYVMSNGTVEAIVVPAIGRIMQFKFAGEATGPFWENRAMDGKHPIPTSKEWGNFGGDKTWPAPQEDWPKITPRAWPPPVAFDSMPVKAFVLDDAVHLISPVDPHYGIQAERVVRIDAAGARMIVETTYHKREGEPRRVAVWIITQLNEPKLVAIDTRMGDKFVRQSETLPANLRVKDKFISLTRHAAKSTKIGTDASRLLWLGEKFGLSIKSARGEGDYPDNGSSAEVYTNPNPLDYVELEMLGPLRTMKIGDKISQTNTYMLFTREETDGLLKGFEN
jgi:hypothetical protein